MNQPVFEGFFESPEDAYAALGARLTTEYFKRSEHLRRQEQLRHNALEFDLPLPLTMRRFTTLPWLLTLTDARKILDFGGGLGWVEVASLGLARKACQYVEFTVVEAAAFFKALDRDTGAALPPSLRLLSPEELIPEKAHKFDVIYSNSVIQYSGLSPLSVLAERFSPDWILLDDVIWSPKSSYWTIQNFYGEKQLHWVPSLTEILLTFEQFGYDLALHMPYTSIIRGQPHTKPPMANLPTEFQCPQALSLLFHSVKNEGETSTVWKLGPSSARRALASLLTV
jgi:putative methyltransferase (TIGR04325 family)